MLAAIAAALIATAALAFGDAGGGAGGAPAGSAGAAAGSAAAAGQPARAGGARAGTAGPVIPAVGAENEYASVISQVGGRYVRVTAIMSNPDTDPHTFEASPAVAREVGQARLVVQNGLGYDSFMNSIESATPGAGRMVIDVQRLLGLPDSTANPHLWYDPSTMPAVAGAIARDLSRMIPSQAAYFAKNAEKFDSSLGPWRAAIAAFARRYRHVRVATTEPVADYLLQAAGADNMTPWSFQAAIMNGVDPSPQDVATERALIADREVSAFVYNEQVTDPLTDSLIALARSRHVPVVGVYETMPEPGYDYQSWMLAETAALRRAVADHTSSEHL
jgi:zinc/manganese transport system substrate-binding protein